MGLPVAMFAIPRTVDWLAQWQEIVTDPEQKITRPRQIFVGHSRRELPTFEVMLGSEAVANAMGQR